MTRPPIIEFAAARVEAGEQVFADGISIQLTGPKVVLVGDPQAILAPLFGKGEVTRGWLKVLGSDLDDIRPDLGLAPLDPPMPLDWTPLSYVTWSARLAGVGAHEAEPLARQTCDLVGLGAYALQRLSLLGLVFRRLTIFAHAAVTSPRLLVIEAPLTGLDVFQAAPILSALGPLIGQACALITTPRFAAGSPGDMLARSADEVALIENGELLEQGRPHELAPAP